MRAVRLYTLRVDAVQRDSSQHIVVTGGAPNVNVTLMRAIGMERRHASSDKPTGAAMRLSMTSVVGGLQAHLESTTNLQRRYTCGTSRKEARSG
jgi:hypothetical protein